MNAKFAKVVPENIKKGNNKNTTGWFTDVLTTLDMTDVNHTKKSAKTTQNAGSG